VHIQLTLERAKEHVLKCRKRGFEQQRAVVAIRDWQRLYDGIFSRLLPFVMRDARHKAVVHADCLRERVRVAVLADATTTGRMP
jgi:hypothetical protein